MDFPIELDNSHVWVYGKEELAQTVIATLRNHVGQFLQDCTYGAKFGIHEMDASDIDEGIRQTIKEIKGVTLLNINISMPIITVYISYNGETIDITYEAV